MSRSAIVFVLLMQVLFSLGYMFFAGYILYSQTANKTWKMHGLGCIELTYDSKEWVLTFFFIILLFSTCIKNKSQNLSTKNYINKTRYSDNGSKRKEQKKKKSKKFHHSSNIWQVVMNSSLHKYICTVFYYI